MSNIDFSLAVAIHSYNDKVQEYNSIISSFPTKFIASMMKYKPMPCFETYEIIEKTS